MLRQRTYLFRKAIDNNYTTERGSIVLPANVRRIVGICPNLVNGSGFVSVFAETNEECLINQMYLADDNAHFNDKNIEVFTTLDSCNLYYVFKLSNTNTSEECELKIIITYEEEV